jgi:hypothetical protein
MIISLLKPAFEIDSGVKQNFLQLLFSFHHGHLDAERLDLGQSSVAQVVELPY